MRDTIDMAREAGFWFDHDYQIWLVKPKQLTHFEALVRADEREQAEERVADLFADMETPYLPDIAAAIRARSNT